jgi:hypothetical protein
VPAQAPAASPLINTTPTWKAVEGCAEPKSSAERLRCIAGSSSDAVRREERVASFPGESAAPAAAAAVLLLLLPLSVGAEKPSTRRLGRAALATGGREEEPMALLHAPEPDAACEAKGVLLKLKAAARWAPGAPLLSLAPRRCSHAGPSAALLAAALWAVRLRLRPPRGLLMGQEAVLAGGEEPSSGATPDGIARPDPTLVHCLLYVTVCSAAAAAHIITAGPGSAHPRGSWNVVVCGCC